MEPYHDMRSTVSHMALKNPNILKEHLRARLRSVRIQRVGEQGYRLDGNGLLSSQTIYQRLQAICEDVPAGISYGQMTLHLYDDCVDVTPMGAYKQAFEALLEEREQGQPKFAIGA